MWIQIIRFACVFLFLFLLPGSYAEVPQEPNYEELCEQAPIVMAGTAAASTDELRLGSRAAFKIVTFEVEEIFKGAKDAVLFTETARLRSRKTTEKRLINLFHMTRSDAPGDRRYPEYAVGKEYLLFLNKLTQPRFYTRTPLDDTRPARESTEEIKEQIRQELQDLQDPNRFSKPGDNLSYTIPEDAEEKIVELTDDQQRNNYSKRAQYFIKGKLVGERAWYGNGRLAYEEPIRNSMRHGKIKSWHPDGSLFEIRPYRKDRLHGILRTWYEKKKPQISYWIRGENVTESEYYKACKTDLSLEKVKD